MVRSKLLPNCPWIAAFRVAVKKAGEQGDEGAGGELITNAQCPIPNPQKQDPPSRIFHRARGITYMVVYNWFGIVPYESIL
jgi:hypothetical protein